MYKNTVIKNVIAVLMLCVFVFSITPKQWLHDVVTNHKDSRSGSIDDKQSISTSGFHCKCDNLVVQSPFINYEAPEVVNLPEFFVQYQTSIVSNLISAKHFFSELRGPPAIS
jgi:hypothetical protein